MDQGQGDRERVEKVLMGLAAHGTGLPRCGECPYHEVGVTVCRTTLCRDAAELLRALTGGDTPC